MCKQTGHNEKDECLGMLPGVANACCGHGDVREAYVQFLDGSVIRGYDAAVVQEILKSDRVEEDLDYWFIEYKISEFEISRYRRKRDEKIHNSNRE